LSDRPARAKPIKFPKGPNEKVKKKIGGEMEEKKWKMKKKKNRKKKSNERKGPRQ
jgi:hypothetical protein